MRNIFSTNKMHCHQTEINPAAVALVTCDSENVPFLSHFFKGTVFLTTFTGGHTGPPLQFTIIFTLFFRNDEGIVPYKSGKGKPFPYKQRLPL